MKCPSYQLLDNSPWKAGDFVWACSFLPTGDYLDVLAKQEPVYGMFAISDDPTTHFKRMDDPETDLKRMHYFIPCKAGSTTQLDWSAAVITAARSYADTERECVEMYNDAIQDAIRRLEKHIDKFRLMKISADSKPAS